MFTDRKVFFTFFKVFCVFASVFILFSVLTSCFFASSDSADSSIVPATSCTVGKFTDGHNRVDVWIDPDTGVNYLLYVWYSTGLATSVKVGGMCPRYNSDGTLYIGGAAS